MRSPIVVQYRLAEMSASVHLISELNMEAPVVSHESLVRTNTLTLKLGPAGRGSGSSAQVRRQRE